MYFHTKYHSKFILLIHKYEAHKLTNKITKVQKLFYSNARGVFFFNKRIEIVCRNIFYIRLWIVNINTPHQTSIYAFQIQSRSQAILLLFSDFIIYLPLVERGGYLGMVC